MADNWRVGVGYDLHPAVSGRPLVLGALTIPNDFGLLGHQDGDVVLHAIIDAMFGAAGLPDMFERFPEDLQQLSRALGLPVDRLHEYGITATQDGTGAGGVVESISSSEMLVRSLNELREENWSVNNVDLVIFARRPGLSPYKLSIRKSVADLMGIEWDRVSIKANPATGLEAIERGRAIACQAVVSLRGT